MRKRLVNTLKRILYHIFSGNIQKRLGYPRNAKLLIIHADDLGLSESENAASIEAMGKGMVNSGSVMIPCKKFLEIADYSKTFPEADIGIHLTLTSEWASYKWEPVLPISEVPSIVDLKGLFLESNEQVNKNAIIDEVEKEYRAQIKLALSSGISLTHIDNHMFTAFSNNRILNIYKSLGKEFMLPVLLTQELPVGTLIEKNAIIVDRLYYAQPEDFNKGLFNFYREALKSMKPGLNCILVHIAFDNEEMQKITLDQISYGSIWRQTDFDFFSSEECHQLIKENNIQLITWREIRDKLIRKASKNLN